MGIFRDMFNEARNSTVPTEYRIAFGQLKRMYNPGEVPAKKELEKDAQMIAKKNHIEEDKFLEFALAQFKMNESKMTAKELISFADENGYGIGQDGRNGYYITKANGSKQRYLGASKEKEAFNILKDVISNKIKFESLKIMNEAVLKFKVGDIVNLDVNSIENSEYINQFPGKNVPKSVKIISPKINVNGDFTFEVPKYKGKEAILPKKFILESAVGKPGRTTEKDAEDHIDDELVAEFRKIIKKLGGKTVAKVLLDKLGQKSEIKDEIEHIEDMIDNSNY